MPETANILRYTARILTERGLHAGPHFASPTGRLDICAAVYVAAHGKQLNVFSFDEDYSIRFIECSADVMQAIRAISDALDTDPPVTEVAPGHDVPDHIEHVSTWAMFGTAFTGTPTTSEVIGRILRTADTLDTPQALAA